MPKFYEAMLKYDPNYKIPKARSGGGRKRKGGSDSEEEGSASDADSEVSAAKTTGVRVQGECRLRLADGHGGFLSSRCSLLLVSQEEEVTAAASRIAHDRPRRGCTLNKTYTEDGENAKALDKMLEQEKKEKYKARTSETDRGNEAQVDSSSRDKSI